MQRKPKRGCVLLDFYCISGQSDPKTPRALNAAKAFFWNFTAFPSQAAPEDTTGQLRAIIIALSHLSGWPLGCLGLDQWCSFKVRTTTPLTGNVAPTYGLQGSTELLSEDIARHSPPRDALSCLGLHQSADVLRRKL